MKAFVLVLTLFATLSAFAQEISRIDADFRCEQKGVAIAVKLPTSTSEARVWQTDPGDDYGLELSKLDFSVFRCPGCFRFEGELMGMIPFRGTISKWALTYEIFDPDLGDWTVVMDKVKCNK